MSVTNKIGLAEFKYNECEAIFNVMILTET
jgi:hypothetical protein